MTVVAVVFFCVPTLPKASKKTTIERLTSSETSYKKDVKGTNNLEKKEDSVDKKPRFQVRRNGLKKHSLAIAIGQTFLRGDFKRYGTDSVTPDLYYGYSASHSFDLLINVHSSRHTQISRLTNEKTFSEISGLAVGIKGRIFQFDLFAPFVIGGFGLYSPKLRREYNGSWVTSNSQFAFGHHFGGGVELELNKHLSLSFIGHYHNPYDIKQEEIFEIEGSYLKLLITTSYIF